MGICAPRDLSRKIISGLNAIGKDPARVMRDGMTNWKH